MGVLLPSSFSQGSFLRGLGWPCCSVWLCWSPVGLWTTPQSDTLADKQPTMSTLQVRVRPPGPETPLCHAFPPSCLLPSPDALSWALRVPQTMLSSAKPPESSLSPSGAPCTCRVPLLTFPPRWSPLVVPRKASLTCSLVGAGPVAWPAHSLYRLARRVWGCTLRRHPEPETCS